MKKLKLVGTLISCGCLVTLATGCASMICGSKQDVAISTHPTGAEVLVYDSRGEVVFQDSTPCVATLKRSSPDSLGGASYTVLLRKEGYAPVQVPLEGLVNRAYFANLMNFVGLFIDPATGAMWTLDPEKVSSNLSSQDAAFMNQKGGLYIALKEQVPQDLAPALVPVKN